MSEYVHITDRKIELTDEGVEALMSDYIPTTEEVRNIFSWNHDGAEVDAIIGFDSWLAEVKAQAWDEGFDAGERDVHEHELTHWDDSDCVQNPYRGENK